MSPTNSSSGDPFGPGDDDFDRFTREVGDGLKDMIGKFLVGQGGQLAWSTLSDATSRQRREPSRPEPVVSADAGSGVWAIVAGEDAGPRVEQVFPTELDALRAHQHNTDPLRRVRFLPYGIAVTALEAD